MIDDAVKTTPNSATLRSSRLQHQREDVEFDDDDDVESNVLLFNQEVTVRSRS